MSDVPHFQSCPLASNHELGPFHCSVEALDFWLKSTARHAQSARVAHTFVWESAENSAQVVAYYSLSAHLIGRAEVRNVMGSGLGRYVPATLIGKLALDESLQGHGLGKRLVVDALNRIIESTKSGPASAAVLIHAQSDRARSLYGSLGFQHVSDGGSGMLLKLSDFVVAYARISRS